MLNSRTPPRGFTRRDFIHRLARFGSGAVLGSLYGSSRPERDFPLPNPVLRQRRQPSPVRQDDVTIAVVQ